MSYTAVVAINRDEMTYDLKGSGAENVLVIDLRALNDDVAAERCAEWLEAVEGTHVDDAVREYVVEYVVPEVMERFDVEQEDIDAERS